MATTLTVDELRTARDLDLGTSEWRRLDQHAIDLFAEATGDDQWLHVDVERAKSGPFGGTIAHGYLTLAVLPVMVHELLEVSDRRFGINYGIDRLRYTTVVPSGGEVRLRARLVDTEEREVGVLYRLEVTMELKGSERPAMVGEVLYLAAP